MSLTPVEIRHVRLGRRLGGYDPGATDRLLAEITESFEQVWRERADLHDQIERLEGEITRYKEQEELLRRTLIAAERAADEFRAQAHREAELIVEEGRGRARELVATAEGERERLSAEIRRMRALEQETRADYKAFLVAALERLEHEESERRSSGQAA